MTDATLLDYLETPRNAILATVTPTGQPHAVPVWFRRVGDELWVITERGSVKHRNAAANPRAALCIDDGKFGYVTAEGSLAIRDTVSYDERLILNAKYRGQAEAKRFVDLGGHERMVMLILSPERWLDHRSAT
jgi:hypothetical protein